jgi:hypothetical protein
VTAKREVELDGALGREDVWTARSMLEDVWEDTNKELASVAKVIEVSEDDELWISCTESVVDGARINVVELPAAGCVEDELRIDNVELLLVAAPPRFELVELASAADWVEAVAAPTSEVLVDDRYVVLAAIIIELLVEVPLVLAGFITRIIVEDSDVMLVAPEVKLLADESIVDEAAAEPVEDPITEDWVIVLAAATFELVEDWVVLAGATLELLLESNGAVELAAPGTKLLLLGDCEDVVLAAPRTKVLLLEDKGELTSVLDKDIPNEVPGAFELEAAELVATDKSVELGALEIVDEVVWLVVLTEAEES